MSFKKLVGTREIPVISMLLSLFGVVEAGQMRRLFSHLSDASYGRIMARMSREGMICLSEDAKLMAGSPAALKKYEPEDRVLCFEVFIYVKDRIQDYCQGEAPALVTVASSNETFDLIPVNEGCLQLINDKCDEIDEKTVRFLLVRDIGLVESIQRRFKNDYVFCKKEDGTLGIYEL